MKKVLIDAVKACLEFPPFSLFRENSDQTRLRIITVYGLILHELYHI